MYMQTLSFLSITTVLSWLINTSDLCVCNQWNEQFCTVEVGCKWNSDTQSCQNYSCNITPVSICNQVSYCYYNGTNCTDFTSCSNVTYNNQSACNNVHYCQYYSGNTCSDFSCSNYSSNSTKCTQNWQCIFTNGQCVQATSCSQYIENCPIGQYCNMNGSVCSPATCSLQSINSCTFVYTTLNGSQIQPCISKGNECVDAAEASQFNTEADCFAHTDNLYYWYYKASVESGDCTQCTVKNPSQGSIIISFAMITTILIIS